MDNGRIMKELKELQDGVKKVSPLFHFYLLDDNSTIQLLVIDRLPIELNKWRKFENFNDQKLTRF